MKTRNRSGVERAVWILMFLFTLVIRGSDAQANPVFPWPSWTDSHYPLIESFAPGMSAGFAGHSKEVVLPKGKGDRNSYELISLGNSWHESASCLKSPRSSGFIHSDIFKYQDQNEPARLAFPIHAHLRYPTEEGQVNALSLPVFKTYILEVNTDTRANMRLYNRVFQDQVSLGSCTDEHPKAFFSALVESLTHKDSKLISVDDVCLTKSFLLEKDKTYEVRVEWSGTQLCGEISGKDEETTLSIGDQFRILADPDSAAPNHNLGVFHEILPRISPQQVHANIRQPSSEKMKMRKVRRHNQ
ncbi:MAG: hypothetical protein ABIQ95_00105 [Bdellovibrionia bacterium]